MVFEPILFGMTGTQIVFSQLDLQIVSIIIACVCMAFMVRTIKYKHAYDSCLICVLINISLFILHIYSYILYITFS